MERIIERGADYFWILAVLVTYANYLSFWSTSRKHIKCDSRLREGYDRLLRGYLRWMIPPWLVMGVGQLFGGLTVFDYLMPSEGNAFVMIWYGTVFIFWVLGCYWIFFRGGAEALAKYPGALPLLLEVPSGVRLYWLILSGVGGMLVFMIWNLWAPGMQ